MSESEYFNCHCVWIYVGAFFFFSKDTCIKLIFWCKSIREIHCLELRVLQVDCTVITSPEDPGEKSFQKWDEGGSEGRSKSASCSAGVTMLSSLLKQNVNSNIAAVNRHGALETLCTSSFVPFFTRSFHSSVQNNELNVMFTALMMWYKLVPRTEACLKTTAVPPWNLSHQKEQKS